MRLLVVCALALCVGLAACSAHMAYYDLLGVPKDASLRVGAGLPVVSVLM